ncbi:NfeD family protein [bacterium]|nr:NfeD family protein [bacterium]
MTVYWLAFGIGLVYVLLSGAIGALAHGVHGGGAAGAGEGAGHELGHGDIELHHADLEVGHTDLDSAHGELDHAHGAAEGVHGGHDSEAGHSGDGIESSGQFATYSPLSPMSLMGTVSGFGAGGLLATYFGLEGLLSLGPALLGGAAMAGLLWLVIGKLFYSLQGSSEAHVEEMIGLEADVITPVEHQMSGEIAYVLGGTRYTAPARLDRPGRVAQHGKVRIRRVQGNVVYVEERRKLLE